MFWCDTCECAYPHGPEGPAAALRVHATTHRLPGTTPAPITGRKFLIGFTILVLAALVARAFGYTLM